MSTATPCTTHHLLLPGVVDGMHQIASRPVEVLAPVLHDLHQHVPVDLGMHVAVPLDDALLAQPHEETDRGMYLGVDDPGVEVILSLEGPRTDESILEQGLVRGGRCPFGSVGRLLLVGAFRFRRRRCRYHVVLSATLGRGGAGRGGAAMDGGDGGVVTIIVATSVDGEDYGLRSISMVVLNVDPSFPIVPIASFAAAQASWSWLARHPRFIGIIKKAPARQQPAGDSDPMASASTPN
jgi:hypothetical protein